MTTSGPVINMFAQYDTSNEYKICLTIFSMIFDIKF